MQRFLSQSIQQQKKNKKLVRTATVRKQLHREIPRKKRKNTDKVFKVAAGLLPAC